jgi:hypothetical protein
MRFERTLKPSDGLDTIKPGRRKNSKGGTTNHPPRTEQPVKFVGVDGEGVSVFVVDSNGECTREHRYVLFGVGEHQIEDITGLSWQRVFGHLYGLYRPGTAYVGFFLGYDFTQIFKTLPENRAHILLTSEGRISRKYKVDGQRKGRGSHPVECQGWHFDILGNKRLRIRPKDCSCSTATCKCKHRPWMYICDVGSFFQTSFLKVIDPKGWAEGTAIVSPEEYATIKEGKDKRSVAILDDDMRRYNRLENEILARVMATLDRGFNDIGVRLPPSKWFGPGQAAQVWLKSVGAPSREQIETTVPPWFFEAARMSYFGGWFEIMMHGIIPGVTHEYDINSAYPSIIANLPCLLHGTYTYGEGIPTVDNREICLVYAKVWSPSMPGTHRKQYIGAGLHRDAAGRILRPMATEGWFWWHELKAAEKAGLVKKLDNRGQQKVVKWVKYHPCDCPPPMRTIADLYEKRLAVGKTSPLGKSAKLIYNSGYGKFAQSVGEPLFANPIYASLITSGCRTMILDAISSHPKGRKDVAMVATDAVYFLSPHPGLSVSKRLGDWDHTERSNLTLFKPGVYWDDSTRRRLADGNSASFKARGINAADFGRQLSRIDRQYERWASDTNTRFPSVQFPTAFSMVTALQALRRHKWNQAGTVTEGLIVRQDSDPSDKRTGIYRDSYGGREIFRSEPYYGMTQNENLEMDWVKSYPYEKRFGMDDPWSEEYLQQFGETPDGSITDLMTWVLKGE